MSSVPSDDVKHTTKFPAAQRARLESCFPEYEEYIRKHNPDFKGRCKALTKWREDAAKEFMKEGIFQELFRSRPGVEIKDWEEAICRVYTNHYNNKFLPSIRRKESKATISSLSSSTSALTLPIDKAASSALRHGLVTFLGDLSARELYASENPEALKDAMDKIHAENADLIGGALRNKALKQLWTEANQDLWKSKIAEIAGDIDANQAIFKDVMLMALQDLCRRDRLGSTIMSFSWAFRDSKNDLVKGGTLWTGYNASEKKDILDKPADHKSQADNWIIHADAVLPRKRKTLTYKFPFNDEGIPVLPNVNVSEASPHQVAILIGEYLSTLWDASHSAVSPIPPIPWDNIASHPDQYFDTLLYSPPVALKPIEFMKSSPLTTYALYEYFTSITATCPFQFRQLSLPDENSSLLTTITSAEQGQLHDNKITGIYDIPICSETNLPPNPAINIATVETSVSENHAICTPPRPMHISEVPIDEVDNSNTPDPSHPVPAAEVQCNVVNSSITPEAPPLFSAQPVQSNNANTLIATHDPSTSLSANTRPSESQVSGKGKKKRGRPAHARAPSGNLDSTSLNAQVTRKKGGCLKRKQPDTETPEVTEQSNKKSNKGWFYYVDQDGKPIDKDGNPVYVDCNGRPILDNNGKPFYFDLNGAPILG